MPVKLPKKKRRTRLGRRKNLLWRKLTKIKSRIETCTSSPKLYKLIHYKWDLETQLKAEYNNLNRQDEEKAVLNIKTNPKSFFSFAKIRQKTKSMIGPFVDPTSGNPNPSPDFAAQLLSDQYKSVFVKPRPEWKVDNAEAFFASAGEVSELVDIDFSEADIENACAELSSTSAPGADGIPASLLKTCRKELRKPLHLLWRSSLDHGLIPSDLLLVLISPIHKGGSRGSPQNYRPVALTSHLTKVFERVVRKVLVNHLEDHGHLPDSQHGFRAFHSTLTQLLAYWDTLLDDMEQGKGVDTIYTDFSKAFDKVETGVLLHELRDCGVKGKLGCWLASFLDHKSRQQAVVVDGRISNLEPVISGVPQGTVLGPVLFLVHIRNISTGLSEGTTASSFADDTRIQRGIISVSDCNTLQADLQVIYSWAAKVNMAFNGDKFECMRYWPDPSKAPQYD